MKESTSVRIPIAIAITAALVRLLPLHLLHPLNWDELEFFTATNWIGQGLVPYRDFWEHHVPLMWFVFAPFTWLTDSPGTNAIIMLRWAQIPVWIATFWLANVWMRNVGLTRFARWVAIAAALCSSLFMVPAVEYRVESLGCLFVVLGLVLAQRERWFLSGVVFCLAGFTNLRLGPVLVVAVLSLLATRRLRAAPIVAGGFAALIACLSYFAVTGSLGLMWKQVWVENQYLAAEADASFAGGFTHRLLVTFGVRLASQSGFELAAVDVGGIVVLFLGLAGLVHSFRRGGDLRLVAILQTVNVAFVAFMTFVYSYHFALIVILMVPLLAVVIEAVPKREVVIAVLAVAWAVNSFAAVFRGKELDLRYQDVIMRDVHARTRPGDTVFSGARWAIRREPAYRLWFMPSLARVLAQKGEYPLVDLSNPPAAVVFDLNAARWVVGVQPALEPLLVRNYIPVRRELWVPAMNAIVPAHRSVTWTVPRDGAYRVYVSQELAFHPWFRTPVRVAMYRGADARRLTAKLPPEGAGPIVFDADAAHLKKGQRVTASNTAGVDVAVILMSTNDRVLFLQPPPGATLEAEAMRVTHWPAFR
ncbi:MAG TPA: hypothetical protein VF787_27485 [Thermoanaerobaculia bacterium]